MRFLIDECLSVDLIQVAGAAGFEAQHSHGLARPLERSERRACRSRRGFVLVTNNPSDFRGIYATTPLHAGLIIIVPNVNRVLQAQLFQAALDVVSCRTI